MALTPTVSKVSVTGSDESIHQVTLNLKVNDSVLAVDVIDQDFTVQYRASHDSVAGLRDKLLLEMQKVIDAYKSHEQLGNSPALANSITTIQNGLVT